MKDDSPTLADYLWLHFYVVLVGFTAILGHLISISAVSLTLWRTAIAGLTMALWIFLSKKGRLKVPLRELWPMLGTGGILGLHWIAFYGSVKLANVSVCLTAMASVSLFAAFIEPLITRRPFRREEAWIGLIIIAGLSLVLTFAFDHWLGLSVGLASAFLAAVFPSCNRVLVARGHSALTLTLYEMLGAFLVCALAACFDDSTLLPAADDWPWLLILSLLCTVYAFALSVHLLKKLTAYTVSLALNFEPVYGILLAAILLGEHHEMRPAFYLGVLVLIAANLAHSAWVRHQQRHNKARKAAGPPNHSAG